MPVRRYAALSLLASLLWACQPSPPDTWQQVSGEIRLPPKAQLPAQAQLTVILARQAAAGDSPQILAELRQQAQPPYAFLLQNLSLDPRAHNQYRLHAHISSKEGSLLLRSVEAAVLDADNTPVFLALTPVQAPTPTLLFYRCEGDGLKVALDGDRATLSIAEHTYTLTRVPSASGTHYQSDAANFWSKGDEAILTLVGSAQRHCIAQPLVHPWVEAA